MTAKTTDVSHKGLHPLCIELINELYYVFLIALAVIVRSSGLECGI